MQNKTSVFLSTLSVRLKVFDLPLRKMVVFPRHLQVTLKTHAQKVCSLYKRAVRNAWSTYDDRWLYRYHARLIRARFDEHKDEKDLRKAKQLLEDGEKELWDNLHYQPRKCK
ncbi:NADH dehydrogenase [ubiquinone] 1 beta subcomplex subunit 9-like [Stegodyphus dumicola]|uniref:NADH dehydrogenase [ubiquinone] 1 beta subcomplex subunit 9-like n=1 Tax=Stegodyphus dumicola TaxID=202533 RepID=UPI0015AD84A3|nr:NADH dehydrogenase [ubiquinone] 1 beta subcomplex subunit 9-like [Stegodyphus dumicola]